MIVNSIQFNNISLSSVLSDSLMLCNFDNINEYTDIDIGITATDKGLFQGFNYNDAKSFTFTLIKKDGSAISDYEQLSITNWLFVNDIKELRLYDDNSNYVMLSGAFTEVIYRANDDNIIGLTFTFVSDSAYVMVHETSESYIINGVQTMIEINVNACDNQEIYPILTITPSVVNEVISIECVDYSNDKYNTFKIKCPFIGTNIIVDNRKQLVYADTNNDSIKSLVTYNNLGWNGNIYWLKLHDGINKYNVLGNCTLSFSWDNIKFIPLIV